ncbi:uncharacterized protein LOC123878356 isoform X1 [Maniola jurtina]|uniref:uncharacterized protein LOC123878356 isoform X1 n=1 Tax=Maniola jurtina TaxID=191418 RepID=UPI001E688DE3|nr:uncharacterized protein LOC123878356 isoform X1 [Maniola jurtina]
MALVIRKTFLPKNVSILKCMKGRPIASAPNKKHTAPLFHNQMKRTLSRRVQRLTLTTCPKLEDGKTWNGQGSCLLYKNASSPCLALSRKRRTDYLARSYSAVFHTDIPLFHSNKVFPNQIPMKTPWREFSTAQKVPTHAIQGLQTACACPCPCPGTTCLPPPCNTPPKCLQYMTGYYYYPYGTWFCGPYHVSTGPRGPCTGPVSPGPNGPCPCGPCGLPCACGPLQCCGVCGSPNITPQTPNSPSAHFVPFSTHGYPYAFNNFGQYCEYYDQTPSFSQYPDSWTQPNTSPSMPSHMPSPYFGPGINVPIAPIPVNTEPQSPITSTANQPSNPKPKSSVRINREYMREPSVPSYGSKPPMPTRPPKPTVYFKPFTNSRQISTCPSNLKPKALRQIPRSQYDVRQKSFVKPRNNSRMMPSDTIQVCYYSTRSIEK